MNILLVEDEPPILREIKHVIESFQEDYQILGTATDGQHALELIEKYGTLIDYILVDIHIPIINGLELISVVKKKYPSIICSILTGYSEFGYAQQAVRLNVADYLLKPLNEEELREQLKRAYEKKCIETIKNPEVYSFSEQCRAIVPSKGEHYRLILICIGSFPFYTTFENEAYLPLWKSVDLEQLLATYHEISNRFWIINGQTSSEKHILISLKNSQDDTIVTLIESIYQTCLQCQYPVTMIASETQVTLQNVSGVFKQLRQQLSNHMILGKSALFFANDIKELPPSHEYDHIASFVPKLQALFLDSRITLFYAELRQYLKAIKEASFTQKALTQHLFMLISSCISSRSEIRSFQIIDVNELVNDTVFLSFSYEGLYHNLQSIFDDLLKSIINEADNTTNKQAVVLKIDAYIKDHHTQPINTKLIADYFGFTPAYLSKIYRDYKQISPSEQITQMRMEKAMELLQHHPELAVKDVSALTGYDDSLYFSKVFKKHAGTSPKKYQLKHQK